MKRAIGLAFAPMGCQQAAMPEAKTQSNRFAGRDGHAEALADIAAAKPVKLYANVSNGYVPGWQVPGLTGCEPPNARIQFEIVPELAFQEGEAPPLENPAAVAFMRSYNLAMFGAKTAEIKKACPKVALL